MHPRVSLLAILAAFPIAIGSPNPGIAQSADQPVLGPGAARSPLSAYDPPARVGRLARTSGKVSWHGAGADHWEPATLNYPITTGDALWTESGATAEVDVANSHLVFPERTELDVDTLDDQTVALTLPQGETYLRLPQMAPGDSMTMRTPRGIVTIQQGGRYDIVAGDTEHPTLVTVIDGSARVASDSMAPLDIAAGQTATLTGTDTFTGAVGAAIEDPFLRAQIAVRVPARVAAAAPVGQALDFMTGADVFDTTGDWAPTPDYGPVWYPPVDQGWTPYQDGNWAYTPRWGWTWVDAEPWGFAPFHYGRWVEVGSRWGWVPDRDRDHDRWARPVFAPALVRWVDVGPRGRGGDRSVGWIPLAPHERFQPWYRSSANYVREVNRTNVTNVVNAQNFTNRRGLTVAPASIVAGSQPIRPHMQDTRADSGMLLASARPQTVPALRPTLATAGVTASMARQVRVAPPPVGFTPRPAAPGPVFQARAGGPAAGHVALRPPSGAPMQPVSEAQGQRPEPGRGPEQAGPGGPGMNGAAVGAIVGGAAAVGGAALLNHSANQREPGRGALPTLAAPHGGPVVPPTPGAGPGPTIGSHTGQTSPAGVPPSGAVERGPNGTVTPDHAGALPGLAAPGQPAHPPQVATPTGPGGQPPAGTIARGPNETRDHAGVLPGLAAPGQPAHQPQVATPTGPGGQPPAGTPAHGPPANGPNENLTRDHAGALSGLAAPGQPAHSPQAEMPTGAGAAPGGVAHAPVPPVSEPHPVAPNVPHVQVPTPPAGPTPPAQAHVQTPPMPQVHAAPPPPQVHAQPPPQPHPAPPPPQVHLQPPPPPHPAAPPPQVHAQAAPAPAPHPAAPPPPAAHPACPPGKHC